MHRASGGQVGLGWEGIVCDDALAICSARPPPFTTTLRYGLPTQTQCWPNTALTDTSSNAVTKKRKNRHKRKVAQKTMKRSRFRSGKLIW